VGEYLKQWDMLDDTDWQARLEYYIDIGRSPSEYIPSTVHLGRDNLLKTLKTVDRITVDSAAGEVSVVDWHARNIHLKIDLARGANILVKQFYYPGWQATLSQNDTQLPLEAAGDAGLIMLNAPPGRYDIKLILHPLWQEVAGTIVSVLGLLTVIVLLASRWQKRPRPHMLG
jgi:hypothetical protein